MRIRTIKPQFFKHDGLAALPPLTRILFQGLWCMADCQGRLEDRPKRIKAEVLPYDDCDVAGMLSELAVNGFIIRYEVKNEHFIAIPAFDRHQRLSGKEATEESRYPAPTGSKREAAGKQRGSIGEAPEKQLGTQERKGKEGKGNDGIFFPSVLDREDFKTVWEEYVAYRKQRKLSTLTEQGVALKLKELAEWGVLDAVTAIRQTIANGWQGIFRKTTQQQMPFNPTQPAKPAQRPPSAQELADRKDAANAAKELENSLLGSILEGFEEMKRNGGEIPVRDYIAADLEEVE